MDSNSLYLKKLMIILVRVQTNRLWNRLIDSRTSKSQLMVTVLPFTGKYIAMRYILIILTRRRTNRQTDKYTITTTLFIYIYHQCDTFSCYHSALIHRSEYFETVCCSITFLCTQSTFLFSRNKLSTFLFLVYDLKFGSLLASPYE